MIKIRLTDGRQAILEGGDWTAVPGGRGITPPGPILALLLETITAAADIPTYRPDPETAVVEAVLAELGGEIIDQNIEEPKGFTYSGSTRQPITY